MLLLVLVAGLAAAAIALLLMARLQWQHRRAATQQLELIAERVSDRLAFRRPEQSDRDFYLMMASDPQAADANGWSGAEPGMVHHRFGDRKLFAQLQASELVAVERTTGIPVATATFAISPIDPDNARSIGIHVQTDHRGLGYGREVMAAAIVLMQSTPGAIDVGTRITNIGMQRIMQQLGFHPEPITQPYRAPNGESYDAYWYRCGPETHPPAGLETP